MKYINNKNNYYWSKTKEREYQKLLDDIQLWKDTEMIYDFNEYVDHYYKGEDYDPVCNFLPEQIKEDWNFWKLLKRSPKVRTSRTRLS